MRPSAPTLALSSLIALALWAPASSTAQAEPAPWWQVVSGSHPSNLRAAPDQTAVQEVSTSTVFGSFAGRVRVGGITVGCLGTGPLGGACAPDPPVSTAAGLREMLEGPYGAGEVEVSGGPVGAAPFTITTPGRWVPLVEVEPVLFSGNPLGNAKAELLSEGSGRLTIIATNLGNAPLDATEDPLRIVLDELPAGIDAYGFEALAGGQGTAGPLDCRLPDTSTLQCDFEAELPPYEAIEIEVPVALPDPAPQLEPARVTVSGGDGPTESVPLPINVSEEPVRFGLERFAAAAEDPGGEPTAQAGAHPFQVTSTVQFNSGRLSGADRRNAVLEQPALPRNTRVTFPVGLAGSAVAVPRCPLADFITNIEVFNTCPASSSVGVASVTILEPAVFGLVRLAVPVFNLAPRQGQPARLGFMPLGVPVIVDTEVDPDEGYRITGEVRNAPQAAQVLSATITLWGVPGSEAHDASRGWDCALYTKPAEACTPPPERDDTPFLRMPTRCGDPLEFRAELEPWNVPPGGQVATAADQAAPLVGCNRVPFDPSISAALTGQLAESPSGLDFELRLPGAGFASPRAEASEAQPKRVEVTLPEGVTVNPSQAEGLATCSESQLARERFDSGPGEGCPQASKIGSIEGATPLISEPLRGSLYIAEPYANPFDALIALYIVARVPERGVLIKQAGVVEPDPRTGQLVSTFDELPQLPYDNFKLRFREGGRAPLVTPPACGRYRTLARMAPWSASDPDDPAPGEVVERASTFEVTRGVDGGPCPRGGVPPFDPGFSAGALNNQAGAPSPFAMRLTRKDGEQDMTRFSAVLADGVLAKIAGLGRCGEAQIAAAKAKDGRAELAQPSCPASSRIGSTLAGAGVGSVLTYVPGSLYLAGPTGGAPLSVVAITPAVAGPFDVGTVVVREALELDPITAQVRVDGAASDPIPHILAGIPLKLRDLRVSVDRPDFTRNATSCEPSQTLATLWGGFLDAFSSADDLPVGRGARYQAAGCRALGFKPRLAIKLRGGVRRGANPALRAHVAPRPGDANFARAVVTLPRSAFLDQAHIRTVCTRVQFAAGPGHGALCPKGAIYGRARAWSPLLDEPATGPVFLRSSDNKLPDLVLALRGPASAPVEVELSARIDSVRGGIRATFPRIPDVPVSRFIMDMRGGKKGLIVNSRHLCHKPRRNRANANIKGQNGTLSRTRPVVRAQRCQKQRKGRAGRG